MFGRITPAVKNILILNVVFFILSALSNGLVQYYGALRHPFSDEFMIHQLVSHMFLHADLRHIFGNMLGLFFLGPMLEMVWGSKRFYIFYFICGFGASLMYLGVQTWELAQMQAAADAFFEHPNAGDFADFLRKYASQLYGMNIEFLEEFRNHPDSMNYIHQSKDLVEKITQHSADGRLLGASGAVFGVILGAAMLFPNTEMYMMFIPVPIKLKYFAIFYTLYEIYATIINAPGDNVAHWAHLGGMLFAFILIKVWDSKRDRYY